MKEHLHLFTRISEAKLSEYESYQIKDIRDNFLFGIYKGGEEFKVYDAIMGIWCYVTATHVLDLSALTTKHKAADAIEEAAKEAYENCEWIDERDAVVEKWIDWL